jgi:hypothetical protein
LITIGFATPQNITDCVHDLTSSVSGSSVTYSSSKFLVSYPEVSEETDISKSSIAISLSGADQTYISIALAENIVNDAVTIYRAFLDANNAIIDDPFLLYKGAIETYTINENETSSALTLNIVSHWADFEKKSGRKTNNTSQQRFFSADKGMEFSSETVLDIKWGRA